MAPMSDGLKPRLDQKLQNVSDAVARTPRQTAFPPPDLCEPVPALLGAIRSFRIAAETVCAASACFPDLCCSMPSSRSALTSPFTLLPTFGTAMQRRSPPYRSDDGKPRQAMQTTTSSSKSTLDKNRPIALLYSNNYFEHY